MSPPKWSKWTSTLAPAAPLTPDGILNRLRRSRVLPREDLDIFASVKSLGKNRSAHAEAVEHRSTKLPELEPLEALKCRVDEASRHVPLERLAVSPQCGFGSDVVGNLISEDDQKRKLERVVELAKSLWQ
jgi:methionine synthase II (cobalamin-independent)